jgi:hypothetical protein
MIEMYVDTDTTVLQNLRCPLLDFDLDLDLDHLGVGDFKFAGNEGLVARF